MRQRNIISIVILLAILMLILPVVATEEISDDTNVNLPDLLVSNPRYYSADFDSPILGAPSGIKFDITNIGTSLFSGNTIIWFSSDRYFTDTLPLNKNNIVEMRSSYRIFPGQTITVALANYRTWGELNKPGVDYIDFGVKTYVLEENKANNNGELKFVVKPK